MFPEPPRTARPSQVLWPHVLSSQVNLRTHRLPPCRTGEPRGAPEPRNQDGLWGQPSSPSPAGDWLDSTSRGAIYTRPAFRSVLRPSLLPSSLTPGSSRPLVTHSCPFQSLPVSFSSESFSPLPPHSRLSSCGGGLLAQSCPTLATPRAVARRAPLTLGILQARGLQWVAMPASLGVS